MEDIKSLFFIIYFSIVVSSKLMCMGLFVKESGSQYIYPYTDSSFNQEETTTLRYDRNLTLDNANDTDRYWQISPVRLTLKKWFEYYKDTGNIKENQNPTETCVQIITTSISDLSEVDGIWVACHDPTLPEDCSMSVTPSSACHPYISYSYGSSQLSFQTVKINLAVSGLAIVRLTMGSSTIGSNARCFDFSLRRDPFSSCEYIKVESNSATGWTQVKSNFSAYDNFHFNSFAVQLIARFEDDVALVDKVEATEYLLCGTEDILCTSTSPGPTHSTSTGSTVSTTPSSSTTTPGDITDPEDNASTLEETISTTTPQSNAASVHVSLLLLSMSTCFKIYSNVVASS